jgi:hypothetical protein
MGDRPQCTGGWSREVQTVAGVESEGFAFMCASVCDERCGQPSWSSRRFGRSFGNDPNLRVLIMKAAQRRVNGFTGEDLS